MSGKWLSEVDIMRGFAILAVIMIHTTVNATKLSGISPIIVVNSALYTMSNYAVPLFVFISGLVLANKYRGWGTYSLKQFYYRRMVSVVPQYLSYSIFYIAFKIIVLGAAFSLFLLAYDFLTGSAYYHLWFFVLIIQLYLLYPLLEKIYEYSERNGLTLILLGACLLVQYLWALLRVSIVYIIGDWQYANILNSMINRIFPSYLFYFILGIFVISNVEKVQSFAKRINMSLLIGGTIALGTIKTMVWISGLMIFTDYDLVPKYFWFFRDLLDPLFFSLIFILIYRIAVVLDPKSMISLLLRQLGKYSFGIFLVHAFYLTVADLILSRFAINYDSISFYLIAFVVTLLLSYFTVMAMDKITAVGLFTGWRRPVAK